MTQVPTPISILGLDHLNLRVAELVDLVQELLLPVASQDKDKIDAALAKFQRSL